MKPLLELPTDPTRPMRRKAIQEALINSKTLLSSVGKSTLTPAEIAAEARLRLERAKTPPSTERSANASKRPHSE